MPPLQTIAVAAALICFAISAYLRADIPGKMLCAGLVCLTIGLVL